MRRNKHITSIRDIVLAFNGKPQNPTRTGLFYKIFCFIKNLGFLVMLLSIVPVWSQSSSQMYLKGEHFFPPDRPEGDLRMNYISLYTDWKWESHFRFLSFQVNGVAEIFPDRGWPFAFPKGSLASVIRSDTDWQFYFSLPSAFASYTYEFAPNEFFHTQSLEVTLGRRIYSWSKADDYWNLGLWNPLSKWNPLTPFQNGLIGTFFDLSGQKWSFQFFAGEVYLPNQIAKVKLEDDTNGRTAYFHSSSRWFSVVPRQVRTGKALFDINYYKRKTPIFDALFQESTAVNLKLWSGGQPNYWMKGSVGYRPVNEPFSIRNKHNAVKVSGDPNTDPYVHQIFAYFPVRHRMLSLEWGLDYEGLSLLFSVGDDHIFKRAAPEGWTFVREQDDFSYLSIFLKYERTFLNQLESSAQLSFISSRVSGVSRGGREHPVSRQSLYKVTDGIGFDLNSRWKSGDRVKWDTSFRYWYSFPDEGGLLSLSGNFWFSKKFFAGAGLFLLGAGKEKNTFLNYFRANDYLFWKVGYAF